MSVSALKLVHPSKLEVENSGLQLPAISVEFQLRGAMFEARFDVDGQRPVVNSELSSASSQHGLWSWDVVELFLSVSGCSTYYEFQLSPLGQYFELEIFEPRRRVNETFCSGFEKDIRGTEASSWTAKMGIPLEKLSWDGKPESIKGNAFAIFAQRGHQGAQKSTDGKTYFSLFLPEQDVPDFHLPQFFQSLLP